MPCPNTISRGVASEKQKNNADQMVSAHPDHRLGQELFKYLKRIINT
jgi:hypothetical protein